MPHREPIRVVHQGDLYVLSVDPTGEILEIAYYPNKVNRLPMMLSWVDLDPMTQIHIQNELIRYNERLHIRDTPDMRGVRETDQE